MESQWQCYIPDSLLLDIFEYLNIADLGYAGQVCRFWCRVSRDDILWHKLAKRIWKIKGPLLPERTSWRNEVKRLFYHVPLIETDCIEKHTDEVLDVAISNNGKYFCTVSKDSTIVMWDLSNPKKCIGEVDTAKNLNWMLTQYSLFNRDDSKVLVCGVRNLTPEQEANEPNGCGAVFSVPDLQLIGLIFLEPFTLFGAWLDDCIFIAGLSDTTNDCIHMRAYSSERGHCPLQGKLSIEDHAESLLLHYANNQTGLFTYEGSRLHQMNVITARVPTTHSKSSLQYIQCFMAQSLGTNQQGMVQTASYQKVEFHQNSTHSDNENEGCIPALSSFDDTVNGDNEISCDTKRYDDSETDSFDTDVKSRETDSRTVCEIEPAGAMEVDSGINTDTTCNNVSHQVTVSDIQRMVNNVNEVPILYKGNQHLGSTMHDGKTNNKNEDRNSNAELEDVPNFDKTHSYFRRYVILVAGEHDVIMLFKVTEEKVADLKIQFDSLNYYEDPSFTSPDYLFHIKDSYITGLSLSPDHRFAYFNHRAVSHKNHQDMIDEDNDAAFDDPDERLFSSELKVGVIDLVTMERVKDIEYKGHIGYSNHSPWYICLDISQDFIVSGSEDGRGYIWEKNYNTCLGTLKHTEGVVNGVAFSPIDQETCVTVCDDNLIKVWRSRNRCKEIEAQKRKESLDKR